MTQARRTPLRELVEIHRDEIKAIAARHQGRSIALFGSAARGDDHAASDLDFIVEFEPGTRPFELLLLGAELEAVLGVPVDIGTPETLREGIRDEVLAEAMAL
ncbi:MAG: nucleotidyltransferase family protein [Acidimicrobiales bacterium]